MTDDTPTDFERLQTLLDAVTRTSVDVGDTQARLNIVAQAIVADLGEHPVFCGRCRTAPMSLPALVFEHYLGVERHQQAANRGKPYHLAGDLRPANDGQVYAERTRNLPPAPRHWSDRG